MIDFTRDPGPLALLGIRARSYETLREEIDRAGLHGVWVVADLSLGAWRGHQVAFEFLAQLPVDLPRSEARAEDSAEQNIETSYADIVGEFIDAEARGEPATIASLNFASRIREEVREGAPRVFMVIAPRFGIPWETENPLFVRLCAQALRGTRSVLVLVAADESDPEVPVDWKIGWYGGAQGPQAVIREDIVGLVPGVIPPALAETLREADLPRRGDLIPLANGHWLVPPERRRHPKEVPRLEFDRFGILARPYGWLDAYAQFHGNNMYIEPWFLYAEGRRRFAEGGTGITLRLMERAITQTRIGLDWGIFQSYAQGLRVALHRFVDATSISDPPTTLPTEIRSFLLLSKGWGLVMIDDLLRAEECFRQARELTHPSGRDRREYLYLLNISALCQLKSGEVENALAMEREIEERSKRLSSPDRRLQYVNSINIARLYRRRRELETAEQYFRDAFSTTLGVRSESDAIYGNVILAKLYADSGRQGGAFAYWMRAGLHWAASGAPEAMGARIVSFILGEKLKPGGNMPEAIAASLSGSILSAAAASGIAEVTRGLRRLDLDGRSAPVFAHSERIRLVLPHAAINSALLSSGFSVFAMQDVMAPRIIGENSMQLRALLYTLLEALAPHGFLAGAGTIIVDDSLGREIPSTPEELLASCVRLEVQDVAMPGEVIALDAVGRARIELCLRAHVGCAVESLAFHDEHALVFFKRYSPPAMLSLEETRLLSLLEFNPTVGEVVRRYEGIDSSEDVRQMLRGLERKRVVNMDLPQPNALAGDTGWRQVLQSATEVRL